MKKEDKKIVKKAEPAAKYEPKKKAAPPAEIKKHAIKAKKEVKKASPAVKHEQKAKKKAIEAPKPAVIEKVVLAEERAEAKKPEVRPKVEKKKPPRTAQYHGVGGRKTAKARVWLYPGKGQYLINGKPMEDYACKRKILCKMALEPFVLTNTLHKYDVYADVSGGGSSSQIGAVRHGVSQALINANPEFRPVLRRTGLLTRDPRVKERKKYGQKRARKRFQYSKR